MGAYRMVGVHSSGTRRRRGTSRAGQPGRMETFFEALALAGGGIFSAGQATALGIDHAVVERARRSGRLVRLARGWYTTAATGRSPEAWHQLRTRAAIRALGPGTLATHHSALLCLGLPTHEADLAVVHVGRRSTRRTRASRGRVLHQLPEALGIPGLVPSSPPSPTPHAPLPSASTPASPSASTSAPTSASASGPVASFPASISVSPAAAIVQTGLLNGPRAALVAADAALRQATEADPARRGIGATTPESLQEAVAAYTHTSGIAPVRQILRLAEARAESPGESLLRHDFHLIRIPVDPQFEFTVGKQTYRADLRVRGTRMLIEFDGLEKYEDPTEHRREDERQRRACRDGWVFARFTWPELGNWPLIRHRVETVAADHGIVLPTEA